MHSITLIPCEIFYDIWYTYMSGQDNVTHAIMVALPCCPFGLSPLNELNRGKLVPSILLIFFEIF